MSTWMDLVLTVWLGQLQFYSRTARRSDLSDVSWDYSRST